MKGALIYGGEYIGGALGAERSSSPAEIPTVNAANLRFSGSTLLFKEDCSFAAGAEYVAWVAQRTVLDGQAPAPDTSFKVVSQLRELVYPLLKRGSPRTRQTFPIFRIRCSCIWQRRQRMPNFSKWDARLLGNLDNGNAAQNLSWVAPLIAGVARSRQQPFRLIKMYGGHGNATAPGNLAHRKLPMNIYLCRHGS